ncbi:MAG: hypothetical protein K940chlam8_00699 [Chlamydiae bacterium]|nr:hypothetical protein [Chlamydiota bacterium]
MKQSRHVKISGKDVELTNEDKILFPKDRITKGDLIAYYQKIAPYMLKCMRHRPIMMQRYPNGINKESFMQKNVSDYFPKWIDTKSIKREKGGNIHMLVCNNKATLTYLANQACITPHMWLSQDDMPNVPDRMIFDLDPSGANFGLVVQGAKDLRDILEKELKLSAFVMTTGSKGLHVVVPIKREWNFTDVRHFARDVAKYLAKKKPKLYTIEPRKNKRRSKVFIDYLRNGYAQTGVAPFAVRPLPGAPIAMPLSWKELSAKLNAQSFNIKNVQRHLKNDPWKNIDRVAKSLNVADKRLDKLLNSKLC